MTPQEIFDTVAEHLFTQKVRSLMESTDINDACAYRDKHGRKCAVGVLIPDELYDEEMEGKSIDHLLFPEDYTSDTKKYNFPSFFIEHNKLLYRLQLVHDISLPDNEESFDVEVVYDNLRGVATDHKLNTTKLEELYCANKDS